MALPDRKPLMESRVPKSIRYTPTEWAAIEEEAASRALEPAVLARMLCMYGLRIMQSAGFGEASLGIPGQMLGGAAQVLRGAQRTRRF